MDWTFNYDVLSEFTELVEVTVYYGEKEILKIDSIGEEVSFYNMDMLDVETYLIETYGETIELNIWSLKKY